MATTAQISERSQQSHKSGAGWRWFYGGIGLIVTAVLAFNIIRPITVLPRITLAPGFALRDQTGAQVTSEDFRGQLTLYSFTYTNCSENCPLTAVSLSSLRQKLNQLAPTELPLNLVTISLDPEQDTTAVLQQFMRDYEENGRVNWHFLTGDPILIKTVVGSGFSLYYKSDGQQVTFEPRYVLVDGWGIIRAEYKTADPDLEILQRDLGLLVQEAQNRDGAARIAYEAAHLFVCYPR